MVFKLSVVYKTTLRIYCSPYISVNAQIIKEIKSNKINHFPVVRKMV